MKLKLKVTNEPAKRPTESVAATRLIENQLGQNPTVSLAAHFAGILLGLFRRSNRGLQTAQKAGEEETKSSRSGAEATANGRRSDAEAILKQTRTGAEGNLKRCLPPRGRHTAQTGGCRHG